MIHFIIIRYLKWMRKSHLRYLFVSIHCEGMIFWVTNSPVTFAYKHLEVVKADSAFSGWFLKFHFTLSPFVPLPSLLANEPKFCLQMLWVGPGRIGLIITKVANIYISTVVYWQVCLFLWKYITVFVWYRHQKICFISKWVYLHQLLRK